MKTIIFVPADTSERNQKFNSMFMNSLNKFHSDIEVRFFPNPNSSDGNYWYRAKPIIACQLFEEGYEMVIGMDNDQVVLGSLEKLLEDSDEYDVGVVLNDPSYPIVVWDITHPKVYNNGLVILKNKEFAQHWKRLCLSPHFNNYQYREQDILTLLCSDYFNYKVKVLDTNENVYGEVIKPHWAEAVLDGDKVKIGETQINVIHFGGGNTPDKGNYRIRFKPDVVKRIEELIK